MEIESAKYFIVKSPDKSVFESNIPYPHYSLPIYVCIFYKPGSCEKTISDDLGIDEEIVCICIEHLLRAKIIQIGDD